jgi:GNAT superfamily N-acetyltransferase
MPEVRRPRADEAEAVASCHIACWREAYAAIVPAHILAGADLSERSAKWRAHLADPDCFVLAAFDGPSCLGFILSGPPRDPALPPDAGHVSALYVRQAAQGQGLGRRFMAAAARDWLDRGGVALALGVLAANGKARAFYEAMGGRLIHEGLWHWQDVPLPDAHYRYDDLADLVRRGVRGT